LECLDTETRFWKYVNRGESDDCWDWTGAVQSEGYGQISISNKTIYAHRVSYELHYGKIPESEDYHGTCICHRCDNRRCVNPNHLFTGSQADNLSDAAKKGRISRGIDKHNAKLSEENITEIREDLSSGFSNEEIGKRYGVSGKTISDVKLGKTWGWVK
jgi:hypothetical protein